MDVKLLQLEGAVLVLRMMVVDSDVAKGGPEWVFAQPSVICAQPSLTCAHPSKNA